MTEMQGSSEQASASCACQPCCCVATPEPLPNEEQQQESVTKVEEQGVDQVSRSDPRPIIDAINNDPELMQRMAHEALSYALTHGIMMTKHAPTNNQSEPPPATLLHAPLTLFPSMFPTKLYAQIRCLTPLFNILYDRLARHPRLLRRLLGGSSSSSASDPFVGRLLELVTSISKSKTPYTKQRLTLAINRSDYMMHGEKEQTDVGVLDADGHRLRPLQVEFNTISAGAGSLSNQVTGMHRFLIDRYVPELVAVNMSEPPKLHLPPNRVVANITGAMAHAHRMFLSQSRIPSSIDIGNRELKPQAVILFVVQPYEANMADQRLLEYELWETHRIPVVRMTLAQVYAQSKLDPGTGLLWLNCNTSSSSINAPQHVASVIYFRAGYTPRDFSSQDGAEWIALERLERSVAIKCPSIAYHLAGSKKIQQLMASNPQLLEKLLPDNIGEEVKQAECKGEDGDGYVGDVLDLSPERMSCYRAAIRSVFAGLWQPDSTSIAAALASPQEFVLKPQREGGGNNLWGAEMTHALSSMPPEQLNEWILMERIRPCARRPSPALKFGQVMKVENALSEIGMKGAVISEMEDENGSDDDGDDDDDSHLSLDELLAIHPSRPLTFHHNAYIGYLLRTKDASTNEGTLMSGISAVDSVVLYP